MRWVRILLWTALCIAWGVAAQAQDQAEKLNMELVGYHD